MTEAADIPAHIAGNRVVDLDFYHPSGPPGVETDPHLTADFAQQLPIIVFLKMCNLPLTDRPILRGVGPISPAERKEADFSRGMVAPRTSFSHQGGGSGPDGTGIVHSVLSLPLSWSMYRNKRGPRWWTLD